MNKPNNKIRPIGAAPTPEQLEEQAKRAFIQKRNSLAEMMLGNAMQIAGDTLDFKPYVDAAIEAADYMMEKLYSVAIKTKEEE